ncbi:hypothetical protein [Coraliomargarita parva]|uniref:hypothetical protein n=1 Tax=Coraliomargarita parva TaxID=3014050 RepID=UPI0022B43D72|nr:hypothetical protein [Coraliomargarita parva]
MTTQNATNMKRIMMPSKPRILPSTLEKLNNLGFCVNGSTANAIAGLILDAAADCPDDQFFDMLADMKKRGQSHRKSA